MTLGQKIKKLRIDNHLTQKDLAEQLYVTFQTVSKWEKDENEPDVPTLREMSKLFGCSLNYLLSEENEEEVDESEEEPEKVIVEQVTNTVHIHQKELHVCEVCKKDISEDDLEMEQICVHRGGRGRAAEYRAAYYHKKCFAELKSKRAAAADQRRSEYVKKSSRISFGFGGAGGAIALGIALAVLLNPNIIELKPLYAVLYSILIGYLVFSMLYCILSHSYIEDVFLTLSTSSIKFPGLIFSWDIEGFIWVIAMKILFAVIAFVVGVFALIFGIAISLILGGVSFPFVLIHNINNSYDYSESN